MKTNTAAVKPASTAATGPVALLVTTRKGAFIFKSDTTRKIWKIRGPFFLGHIVHHMLLDPRDRRSLLLAARTGHLGPTVFRSADMGKTWTEASRPPAFAKVPDGLKGRVLENTDRGAHWQPLNAGCRADFYPDPYPEFGHDPHCVRMHPLEPYILYQQNHCGIYRLDRRIGKWGRIGAHMPKAIGDIGFPMVLHPRNADSLGYSRWTVLPCGHAPTRAVNRPVMSHAMPAAADNVRITCCHPVRPGTRSNARP